MDVIDVILSSVPAALASSVGLALALWNADKLISAAGATRLYGAISQTLNAPETSEVRTVLESFLDCYFSPGGGFRFFLNVLILTLASMIFVLALYSAHTPGMSEALTTRGFIAQFFGNGFLVTFIVNCVVFSQYKTLTNLFVINSILRNMLTIFFDITIKAVLFTTLTLATYMGFTLISGAFGGNIESLPKIVATTIIQALQFKNLTSVYIYSLTLSSLPVFVVVLIKLMILSPGFAKAIQATFFWLPFEGKPIRAVAVVFSALAALFALAFYILLSKLGTF
ncbi:hypothetical protein [Pseudomonas sichuanensis]|uniref:hypothetical protein n=1 Tax=Pseudomonas sichuanensis TaxID=2213015 RepID=UPI00130059C5|nr:hypothetical protein [Pseudomonas sichuanensis]